MKGLDSYILGSRGCLDLPEARLGRVSQLAVRIRTLRQNVPPLNTTSGKERIGIGDRQRETRRSKEEGAGGAQGNSRQGLLAEWLESRERGGAGGVEGGRRGRHFRLTHKNPGERENKKKQKHC